MLRNLPSTERTSTRSIATLRKQLAMGNVAPVLEDSRALLIGRGYNPNFSADGWRKIAHTLTQAFLEAYEGIKKRQEGAVVAETSTACPASSLTGIRKVN